MTRYRVNLDFDRDVETGYESRYASRPYAETTPATHAGGTGGQHRLDEGNQIGTAS